MEKKKYIIAGTLTALMIGCAGYGIAKAVEDTCGFDPETGYHHDGKGWAANSGWDEAIACAKEGKLPDSVAKGLGIWGDKKTQAEGRKWAAINAKVKAEKAAAAKAEEAKKSVDKTK